MATFNSPSAMRPEFQADCQCRHCRRKGDKRAYRKKARRIAKQEARKEIFST